MEQEVSALMQRLRKYDKEYIHAFLDLLEMPDVFPFETYLRTYAREKDRIDFKRLNNALKALESLYFLVDYEDDLDFYLGGTKSPLHIARLHYLDYRTGIAWALVRAAVEAAMRSGSDGTLNNILAMLLRSALETGFQNMLFDHLQSLKYRRDIEKSWDTYKQHENARTITRYYDEAKAMATKLKEPIGRVLRTHLWGVHKFILFRHVVWLLEQWNVWPTIPDAAKFFRQKYSTLSKDVHFAGRTSRRPTKKALEDVIVTIDHLVLGTLATMKNVASRRLHTLRDDFEWKFFLDYAKAGGLKHTEAYLCKQLSILLQKKSFKWFSEMIQGAFAEIQEDKHLTDDMIIQLYKQYGESNLTFTEWFFQETAFLGADIQEKTG